MHEKAEASDGIPSDAADCDAQESITFVRRGLKRYILIHAEMDYLLSADPCAARNLHCMPRGGPGRSGKTHSMGAIFYKINWLIEYKLLVN